MYRHERRIVIDDSFEKADKWRIRNGHSSAYPSFEARVVGVPRDDWDAQVAGKLEEVLAGCRRPSEQLTVGQVEDRRHVVPQKLLAQIRQDL